MFIFFY
jgi:hypothetical protein